MAGPGKKPNPLHLTVVDKAHAHRYKDLEELQPSKDRPIAPDYLTDEEALIFEKMVDTISELYPPSKSHTEMIALYAQNKALSRFLDYQLKYIYASTSYETIDKLGNRIYKPYPEVAQLQNARRACADILREFGLSPSSQRCVKISKPKVKRNAFSDLDETG